MPKLNIALIGAGGRGSGVRLPHILVMNDVFNLVAICDCDEPKAKELAHKHGVRAYGRIQDLVKNESLDIAAVSTPGDSHHAICTYLAEHKINVIVETPIAITLPLADLIIKAVEANQVKLEVAENYPRDPIHLMKCKIIKEGFIGELLRIYSLFQTGGYHMTSSLRMLANAEAVGVTGVNMNRPIPLVKASEVRQYTTENWSMGIIDFANAAVAITAYSPIYHARALGRKTKTFFQIDGTTGSIVEDQVYLTTEEQRLKGGQATPYPIKIINKEIDATRYLERLEIETAPKITWENPYPQYRVGLGSLAIIEELDSIAKAVLNGIPTCYDALQGRNDMEVEIAMEESGRKGRKYLRLPLNEISSYEEEVHERFRQKYGHDPMDVEALVDFFFPKV